MASLTGIIAPSTSLREGVRQFAARFLDYLREQHEPGGRTRAGFRKVTILYSVLTSSATPPNATGEISRQVGDLPHGADTK